MRISPIGNYTSFNGNGIQRLQQSASKALNDAFCGNGAANKLIGMASKHEGKISKFPIIFAETVAAGVAGAADFSVKLAKNLIKGVK